MGDTEKKTLRFAGRDIDQSEFVRRAQAKANEWMDYQGLEGDQRSDFMNEFNNQLNGIVNGTYQVNDVGEIEGATDTGTQYYGAQTGRRKRDGQTTGGLIPIVRRDGFNPSGNVATYLNGIAGAMSEYKKPEETKKTNKKAWNNKALARHVANAVFGVDADWNDDQVLAWANGLGDVIGEDGLRGTANRKKFIFDEIRKYQNDLNNGVYDITDEDKAAETQVLNQLLDGSDLQDWELNRLAPWMSHLLFTGEKYYSDKSEEQRVKDEKAAKEREAKLADYIEGKDGATNPYEKGTDEYNAAEERKKQRADEKFSSDFYNKQWSFSSNPNDSVLYEGRITGAGVDPSLFSNTNAFNTTNMKQWFDNAKGIITDQDGYDIKNIGDPNLGWMRPYEFGHDDLTGWGKGDTQVSRDLEAYNNALANDFKLDDTRWTGGGFGNVRGSSNKNWLAQAGLSYYHNVFNQPDFQQFKTSDNEMIIPDMIDWETGKVYVYSETGNGRAKIRIANLGEVMRKLNNAAGRKYLLDANKDYIKNKVPKGEEGIKLSKKEIAMLSGQTDAPAIQEESKFTPIGNPFAKPLEQRQAEDAANYEKEIQQGADETYRNYKNNKTEFSSTDWARLGTAAADLTGALMSAFGISSTAGALVGATSTLTQFGLDIADGNVGFGEALLGLGSGLALDALTLIPGVGAAGGVAKAARTISKLAGPLFTAFQLINNGEGAIKTLDKIVKGDFKQITVGEWREFTKSLNAVCNGTTMGKTAYDRRIGKFAKYRSKDKEFTLGYKDAAGNDQTIKLTGSQIKQINQLGKKKGNDAALNLLKSKTKKDDITLENLGVDYNNTGILGRFKNKSLKPEGNGIPVAVDLRNRDNEELAKINQFKGIRRWVADKFGTDYINATGGRGALNNRLAAYTQADADELAAIQAINASGRANIVKEAFNTKTNSQTKLEALLNEVGTANKAKTLAKKERDAAEIARKNAFKEYTAAYKKSYNPKEKGLLENENKALTNGSRRAENIMNEKYKVIDEIGKHKEAYRELVKQRDEAYTKYVNVSKKLIKNPSDKKLQAKQQKAEDAVTLLDDQIANMQLKRKDLLDKVRNARKDITRARKLITDNNNKFNNNTSRISEIDNQSNKYNAYRNALNDLRAKQKAYADKVKESDDVIGVTYDPITKKYTSRLQKMRDKANARITNINDPKYQGIVEKVSGIKIEGRTPQITKAKQQNFQDFISALDKSKIGKRKILELLHNKDFIAKARAVYQFKRGGNFFVEGSSIQSMKAGDKVVPTGARTVKKKNDTTPKDPLNPWITALEDYSYRDSLNLNSKMVDLAQQMKVPYSTPVTINYKTHSAKDLTDKAQEVRNRYNEAAARATKNISDQGLANAVRLANMTAGENAAGSYELQASAQNRADVDKATEISNTNNATRIQTADKNKAADVAKYNQDVIAILQGLNKLGTQRQQHAKAIEAGLAQSSILAYDQARKAAVTNDPIVLSLKSKYDVLARKNVAETLTDEEEKQYRNLAYDIREAQRNALNAFDSKYREPNTRPYGYYYNYTTPTGRGTFDFYNFSDSGFSFKTGGKMEAAEIEKTRREYAKLFHDTQKFLVSESNKKLKNSGLDYFRKLMMQKS